MSDVLVPLDTLDDLRTLLVSCQNYFEAIDIADAHRKYQEDVEYSPLSKEILSLRKRLDDTMKDHFLQEHDGAEIDYEDDEDFEELPELEEEDLEEE